MKPTRADKPNLTHPLARGLFHCWLFNEGGGDRVLDCVEGAASTTWGAGLSWTASPAGHCIYGGGSDGNVWWAYDPRHRAVAGFSVALAMIFHRLPSVMPQNGYVISAHNTEAPTRTWYWVANKAADELRAVYADADGVSRGASSSQQSISVNRLYRCVMTCAPDGIRFYVNGTRVLELLLGPIYAGGTPITLRIGHSGSDYCPDAQYLHLMFWNRGLTETEARQATMDPYGMFRRQSPLIVAA